MKMKMMTFVAIVLAFALQANGVLAYGAQRTGSIGNVSITVSNMITTTKTYANAKTDTSSPSPSTSVTATFYWTDYETGDMSSTTKSTGNYGNCMVYIQQPEDTRIYYYQVISSHLVRYSGAEYNYSNLTTFVP